MSLNAEQFATKISDVLDRIKETCMVKTINLGDYGTSYEITKHNSNRKLHLTPVEDGLIDMILYDETGTTIVNGTLFDKAVTDNTPENLAKLVAICF